MKRYVFVLVLSSILLLLSSATGYSQLSVPATPPGFSYEALKTDVPVEVMREVDVNRLLLEDQVFDTIRDIPWRFGDNIDVQINPQNSGRWDYMKNGDKVWRVSVYSSGAYSLNFTFDQYLLPPGAKLFLYNHDRTMVLGAFTNFNNQDDGYFATTLVDGDLITLEYYEPTDVAFPGLLNLSMVTHAYRNPYDFAKAFGQSGSCNLNVACDQAEGWEQQIRSVAMLVAGGNGFCTGALINNTESDGKPLFLSANHCYRNPSTLVFWFNWQSETCANPPSSPPYNSMSGATQRARNAASDFWLVELNQPVPEEFNPFFAGWNRTLESTLTETIIGVHHPRGDIKKFSYATTGVQQAGYLGAPGSGTTHWRIVWSGGTTTEPGSSGSPIFDSQGRILGQLHGGYAACGNTQPDWYGRLGVSWTGAGSAATRLSNWLDPNDTGIMVLDGYDPLDPGVENPLNFTATNISNSQILLEWILNNSGQHVMIAVNTGNSFGFPEGPYTLEDTLEGGGKIIYMGEGLSYIQNNLDAGEEYFYRIWSYSPQLIYSKGLEASAVTLCNAVTDFPLFEGFNEEVIPSCWSQEYVQGVTNWLVGVGNNDGYPVSAYEGEKNVFFRVFSVADAGSKTRLTSPILDLSPWSQAQLSFWYANPANFANQDVLRVFYRSLPDGEWELLQTFSANEHNWTNSTLDLPMPLENIQIAFEAEGNRGRGVSLDKVEIFASMDGELPNPVNLTLNITNGNQPELQWETEIPGDKDGEGFDGFNVYRNNTLVFAGDDPLQTNFTDQALPVGNYTYFVKARLNDTFFSAPSNEATADITATGNEISLNLTVTGQGTTFLPEGTYQYLPGSQVTLLAEAAPNWNFSHWNVDGEETGTEEELQFTLNASTEIEAVFLINQYEVTVQADPADAAAALSGEGTYEHGATAQFIAEPAVGYVFRHWKDDGLVISTKSDMQLVVTSSKNLLAVFAEQNHELTIGIYPPESGTATGEGIYGVNTMVTVNAQAQPGWSFSHWTLVEDDDQEETVSGDAEFSFVILGDTYLVANFDPIRPTLLIEVEGSGTTIPGQGEYIYTWGEEIVFTATADEGWQFVKWVLNGVESFVSQFIYQIEEDVEALAVFELPSLAESSAHSGRITLYPVPAREHIYVAIPAAGTWQITLLNVTGQVQAQYRHTGEEGNSLRIATGNLPGGVYLIRAENSTDTFYGKFVRE